MKTNIIKDIATQYNEGSQDFELSFVKGTNFYKSVSYKLILFALLMIALLISTISLQAQSMINIDQSSTGKIGTNPLVVAWQNGNLGGQNSHFLESYSIPYRGRGTGFTSGQTYTLVLGYDIKVGGKAALDGLTHYQRLLPHNQFQHTAEVIDPLDDLDQDFMNGITNIGSPSTSLIPAPSSTGSPQAGQPTTYFTTTTPYMSPAQRQMTLYGGTITAIGYDFQGSWTDASSESRLYITFVANGPNIMFAWGGNIAAAFYWNPGLLTAKDINGSPYHMHYRALKSGAYVPWASNKALYDLNIGSADRSLKTDAIFSPPACSLDKTSATLCAGGSVSVTVTPSGGAGGPYTFEWTGPNNFTNTNATINLNNVTTAMGGTYSVIVKDKNGLAAIASCDFVLNVSANPTSQTLVGGEYCTGTTVSSVILNGSVTGFKYQLQKLINNTYQNIDLKDGTGAALNYGNSNGDGTYRVLIYNANNSACSLYTSTAEVKSNNVPAAPQVTVVGPFCDNASFTVTVTSPTGAGIEYKNGENGAWQTSNIFSGLQAGDGYKIYVKNASGCVSAPAECSTSNITSKNKKEQFMIKPNSNGESQLEELLLKVYPNPFNSTSTIEFKVDKTGQTILSVYDINGREINTLFKDNLPAGVIKQVTLDGSNLPNGLYFTRLMVDGQVVKTAKIVLEK